jgi:predicted double-glycine peptidase
MPVRYRDIPAGAVRVPVPDTEQDTDATCGASSLLAVCLYYGVGPVEEREVARDMGMDLARGANPEHIVKAAQLYGLRVREEQPMCVERLRELVGQGKPVVCMLQAWGGRRRYWDDWADGHWVVAIGWDRSGVYFEDPSIAGARGFLSYEDLEDRWHDVGAYGRKVPRYGVALWRPRARPAGRVIRRARRIA